MKIKLGHLLILLFTLYGTFFFTYPVKAEKSEPLILKDHSIKIDMYKYIDLIKVEDEPLMIEDVIPTGKYNDSFKQSKYISQKSGFFKRENWIRFDVYNDSHERDWILEFAFPLINDLDIYMMDEDNNLVLLYETGSNYPFSNRNMEHRNFVFDIAIQQNTKKTFYAYAVGSGDLHPPITIWDKDEFVVKTSKEFLLLGLFYGIVFVMIAYNLFLYISLKMRSYLYYVITIIFVLLGKLSLNGIAFQYLWPNNPTWNLHAVPIWVSLGSIFILIFSRNFLDIRLTIPSFNTFFYMLIALNCLTLITLPLSRYIALHLMIIASLTTFIVSIIVAIICLIRGVRQARFYLLSWIVFITGVSITILERAVIIPYSAFTEYAGQAALTIEVVLLSFALADKINIMRVEKEDAIEKYHESQLLAMENLQKADKLKDDFLAIVSHELRTPLYGMIGIAESLHDGVTGTVSEAMKQQLSIIIRSGHRLTYLVDEILDFSKLKYESVELDLKPVDVSKVIELVVAISKPMIREKPIDIINNINRDIPTILADENRLQQIFHNIIDNAIKYTEEGEITITARQVNDFLNISITDTGQGMDDDVLNNLFKPFKQGSDSTDRDVKGVGIGLNIAMDLIQLHDGELHVTSELHLGSTFELTFPIYGGLPKEEKVAMTIMNHTEENYEKLIHIKETKLEHKAKILIADDEIVNLQVLTNQLTLEGYEVYTTQNGHGVFDILENHNIDLIILDIMMPHLSGYDVCKQLRKSYTLMELPILMLTAKNQLQDKMLAFEAGANDYLVKPCDKQELLSRVKTLVKVKTLNEELIQININLEDKVLERTHELKVANEDLRAMAHSRRQMLANIAHELGTPVTLVYNYIQSVKKGIIKADDERYQLLVKDKVNILNRLVEDLFDLSMLEANRIRFDMEDVNLYTWLTEVYDRYELTTTEHNRTFQKLGLNSSLKNFSCYIDIARMNQLFINLIDNAIKHTDEHIGLITMTSKVINDHELLIQVSDNGTGIDQESLPLVFERFYKLKENKQKGTGLGLAIAKQIVLNHNGTIWAESQNGKGATFSVVLPINLIEDHTLKKIS